MIDAVKYDKRHGGPWDRGSADSWYSRRKLPHYYKGDTGNSDIVPEEGMTELEIEAYYAGYEYNDRFGDKKSYE